MGVIESVRGVMWARKRRPDDVAYLAALAHERFTPRELVVQAVAAESAGFDGVCCSDHLAPWWEPADGGPPAACGNAWVWLGAVGMATSQVALGTSVTALVHRYNPVVVAQQLATLEDMFPGRAFLGVGSGEAMNEVPAGMRWPSTGEQLARTEEALTIVTRLLDGETVDFEGRYFRAEGARLFLTTERRPPVYMSAFHEGAAEVAGRLADGVICLGDPTIAPGVIAAYRRGAEAAGREPGEIILQTLASFGVSDDAALASSREWKATLVDATYTDDLHDPREIGAAGEDVSDRTFTSKAIVSSDPDTHVKKLKLLREMGATAIVVMNVAGEDPDWLYRAYGAKVLPELRG
jgi:coenzyme F420-dependent glucose-6-phosphate dehydrogenase